jgi:hypothetical protein
MISKKQCYQARRRLTRTTASSCISAATIPLKNRNTSSGCPPFHVHTETMDVHKRETLSHISSNSIRASGRLDMALHALNPPAPYRMGAPGSAGERVVEQRSGLRSGAGGLQAVAREPSLAILERVVEEGEHGATCAVAAYQRKPNGAGDSRRRGWRVRAHGPADCCTHRNKVDANGSG